MAVSARPSVAVLEVNECHLGYYTTKGVRFEALFSKQSGAGGLSSLSDSLEAETIGGRETHKKPMLLPPSASVVQHVAHGFLVKFAGDKVAICDQDHGFRSI